MIKIQEHLDLPNVEIYLDTLAQQHWETLNPKLASGRGYKKNSLIEKCKTFSAKTATHEYLKKYAGKKKLAVRRHKKFFEFFSSSNSKELKAIIISRPAGFAKIKKEIFAILKEEDLYTGTPGNYKQTAFGKLCSEELFNYPAYRGSQACMQLYRDLKFTTTTCPYCNDHNVMIVPIINKMTTAERLKAYLDLDHFYPKSLNPFFALSFFNLIPVCRQCNSDDKGSKPFSIETHIHPYCESFDDQYTFGVSMKNRLGVPTKEIEITKTGTKALDRTLDDLLLVERAQGYLTDIDKLVDFYNKYSYRIGTPDAQIFIDTIFEIKGVPKERKHILVTQRGKMFRDILKGLDIANNLGFL